MMLFGNMGAITEEMIEKKIEVVASEEHDRGRVQRKSGHCCFC